MKFHQFIERKQMQMRAADRKENFLQKITSLFHRESRVDKFIYEIEGIQIDLDDIKHGILRGN